MSTIYVDADACPVREEVLRVAVRHGLESVFVTDGGIRPLREPNARLVIVDQSADAADDWIACAPPGAWRTAPWHSSPMARCLMTRPSAWGSPPET